MEHTHRSSNRQTGGVDIILRSPKRDEIECLVCLDFPMTNNEAEYEAQVAGLDLAKVASAASVVIHCDSQVVMNKVNGDYECKGERMKKYLEQVKRRVDDLQAKTLWLFIATPRLSVFVYFILFVYYFISFVNVMHFFFLLFYNSLILDSLIFVINNSFG